MGSLNKLISDKPRYDNPKELILDYMMLMKSSFVKGNVDLTRIHSNISNVLELQQSNAVWMKKFMILLRFIFGHLNKTSVTTNCYYLSDNPRISEIVNSMILRLRSIDTRLINSCTPTLRGFFLENTVGREGLDRTLEGIFGAAQAPVARPAAVSHPAAQQQHVPAKPNNDNTGVTIAKFHETITKSNAYMLFQHNKQDYVACALEAIDAATGKHFILWYFGLKPPGYKIIFNQGQSSLPPLPKSMLNPSVIRKALDEYARDAIANKNRTLRSDKQIAQQALAVYDISNGVWPVAITNVTFANSGNGFFGRPIDILNAIYGKIPKNGGGVAKVLYKGYYYKVRTDGRRKFIRTKHEGDVALATALKKLKKRVK